MEFTADYIAAEPASPPQRQTAESDRPEWTRCRHCHQLDLMAVGNQVIVVGNGLSTHQFLSLKLACRVMGIKVDENVTRFSDLYQLIEQKMTLNHAPAVAYQLLVRVGYPEASLQGPLSDSTCTCTECTCKANVISSDTNLDLLLTLAEILGKMSTGNYECFRDLVRRKFLPSYHQDQITSPCHLLQLLFDQNKLQLDYIYTLLDAAGCSVYHADLDEFCSRRKLEQPDWETLIVPRPVPPQVSVTTVVRNSPKDIDNAKDIEMDYVIVPDEPPPLDERQEPQKCGRYRWKCWCPTILLFTLAVICGTGFGIFIDERQTLLQVSNYTSFIGANAIVQLNQSCFHSRHTKEVTIFSTDDCKDTVIYQIPQNSIGTQSVSLPYKRLTRKNPPGQVHIYRDSSQVYMNYFTNSYPFYTAGPGNITYWINLTTYSSSNNDPCPLRLFAFTTYASFHGFLTAPYLPSVPTDAYNDTGCLHGNDTHPFTFPLEGESFYYFALSHASDVSFEIYTSGVIREYDVKGQVYNCTLVPGSCTIQISGSNIAPLDDTVWCLFASSANIEQGNVIMSVLPVSWSVAVVSCLSAATVTGLLSVCLVSFIALYVTIGCYKKHNRSYSYLKQSI